MGWFGNRLSIGLRGGHADPENNVGNQAKPAQKTGSQKRNAPHPRRNRSVFSKSTTDPGDLLVAGRFPHLSQLAADFRFSARIGWLSHLVSPFYFSAERKSSATARSAVR